MRWCARRRSQEGGRARPPPTPPRPSTRSRGRRSGTTRALPGGATGSNARGTRRTRRRIRAARVCGGARNGSWVELAPEASSRHQGGTLISHPDVGWAVTLIGRLGELEALEQALSEVGSGNRAAVEVVGE